MRGARERAYAIDGGLYERISSELKKLERISSLIEDLLKDAEINDNTAGEAFKLWLHSFEELVYETDSLLSDVGEKAMRRQLIEESYANITSKKKKTGVDNLRNHLDNLGGVPHKRRPKTRDVIRKMVISPDVDETTIMGQKHNKEPKFFNDEKVKDHFEFKAWVPVYDKFDAIQISSVIFQCVSGEFKGFSNQDILQQGALANRLLGKMTSGTLQTMSRNASKDVLLNWHLEVRLFLPLLAIDALGEQNFDSHLTFWLLAKRICEKCQGLPLALESVGKLLKTKTGVEDWEMVLNNKIWDCHSESDSLFALKLSYNDLPPHLRKLFLFCSLFPKGYMYRMEEQLQLWMTEGQYFYSLDDENGNNQSLEMLRHFSFVSQQFGTYSKFKALEGTRRLLTFIAIATDVQDLEETIRHKQNKVEAIKTSIVATFEEHEIKENQDNLNEISKEKDDAKLLISVDNFGSNGVNDLETSGSKTPAKVVVDNRDVLGLLDCRAAHNFAQPNTGTGSEVVAGLPKDFQEGDMVDALSRVVEKKS
ncbi:putative disease resistance RPP13-like protein 1 [Tanacetum coccineum]